MQEAIDIEVRVEQLASQINADPEAFALCMQGIAQAIVEQNIIGTYLPLAEAMCLVADKADIVAAHAE